MADEDYVLRLDDLKESAKLDRQRLSIGERIVFNGYSGTLCELELLTGVIVRVSNDCMWTFTVEIDRPDLLDPTYWNASPSGGLQVCLAGNGLVKLSDVQKNQPEYISKLNQNQGIALRPVCSKEHPCQDITPALRALRKDVQTAHQNERDADKIYRDLEKQYVLSDSAYVEIRDKHKVAEQARLDAYRKKVGRDDFKVFQDEEYALSEEKHKVFWGIKTRALEQHPDYRQAQDAWSAANNAYIKALNDESDEIRKLLEIALGHQHPDATMAGDSHYDGHDLCHYLKHRCPHCNYVFSVPSRKPDEVVL